MDLKDYIRDIPDFPSAGILFRDITPLLKDSRAFHEAIDRLAEYAIECRADAILGIDSRGFLMAAPLAYKLDKPLILVRKGGKLPFATHKVTYALEYGSDCLEIHTDSVAKGHGILIVDDLLATGGTMAAAASLVLEAGGFVAGLAAVVELDELDGRKRLEGYDLFSLIKY